jgi:hypothetical protein
VPTSGYGFGPPGNSSGMSDEEQRYELTEEELQNAHGEQLPDREVMTRITFEPGPPPLDPEPGYTLPIEPPATE